MLADAIPLGERSRVLAANGLQPIADGQQIGQASLADLSHSFLGQAELEREAGNRHVMFAHQPRDVRPRERAFDGPRRFAAAHQDGAHLVPGKASLFLTLNPVTSYKVEAAGIEIANGDDTFRTKRQLN